MTDAATPSGQRPNDTLQRLWAPWRYAYVTQNDDVIDGCPFCVLPSRPVEQDRAGLIVHRGTHNVVMLNAYPYNPGHLMVLPYAHMADLAELSDAAATEMFHLTRQCVALLDDRLHCDGVNVGMNLGAAAGAGIADHLHMHAVPRWAGDTNFMTVTGHTRVLPRALDDMYAELADAFTP